MTVRVNGGEGIIEDKMVLWRNLTSFQIQNKVDGGRVELANAKIDATTTATSPFWYLLAVLKFGIKDVDRTTKKCSRCRSLLPKCRLEVKRSTGEKRVLPSGIRFHM